MEIRAYYDETMIFSTSIDSMRLINPKITQELNKVGTFSFTIYPDHPYYSHLEKMKGIITVYEVGVSEPLFRGRIYDEKIGFYNEKQVTCEGELAFLLDTIQRPWSFPTSGQTGTPAELLTQIIAAHNAQVDAARQFTVGNVTVTDPNNYITRSESEYVNTWDTINNKLLKTLGGYLWVRHENGVNYIDYLEDFTTLSNQTIEFGKNLLDLTKEIKADKFATAVIPLGAKLKDEQGQDTGERLTIKSVNDDIDYVFNADAVAEHGYIFTTQIWDDVTVASNLKTKGQVYIDDLAQFAASINISAADLNGATIDGEPVNVNSFRIGRYVKVNTAPHSIDGKNFIVNKLSRELLKPENTKLTLGTTYKSLTEKQADVYIPKDGKDGKDGAAGKDAAIQSTTAPTDTSYMWLDISVEPPILKRYNGTEWVVVNDMSENIQILEQSFNSSIENSEQSLKNTMSENYYTKDETSELVSSVQTSWEQTAQGFEARFTTISKEIGDVADGADARFQEISSYIRFENGNIILGKSDSPLILKQENDCISFIQNNSKVAYFSDDKLYVTYGEFLNSIKIGNFAFIPRENGNLSFKKIT